MYLRLLIFLAILYYDFNSIAQSSYHLPILFVVAVQSVLYGVSTDESRTKHVWILINYHE